MRVRYASRIVTRVFTLLVMTASLTTNARVSATLSGVFQESTGTLNDQPSSPRLLALRDRLTAGDRTALDKFWKEIREQGAPIIESATDNDREVLVTMLWRAREETRNVFVFRLGDVSKSMARLLGKYTYKFLVDGVGLNDPANSATEDDGNGHMDSVIIINPSKGN